jgi:hypothetical protein
MAESELVPVFVPALVVLLAHLEREKGAPLTEQEVIEIRDKGACIMMRLEHARALADKRGYDLDPQNVWAEWQLARIEIGNA